MFSPLARGKADWDGDLQCEEYSDQTSPLEPLLPQLLNQTSSRNKSARSTGSFFLEDGQLALPKTFVTRKGAIILFTPSEDLCHHGNGESHLKKENVYEAGLKLRTLGNLTNSVLEFGKEDEETWEGIPNYPNEKSGRENPQKRDKTFLRFLHYLDSENLTADKHVQPGADPDYYLEELKKSSGQNSHRRFRSQTPFSTKTSYSTNTASHYSQFLDDDEEITGVIQDYMKYGRSGRSKNKERLEHRVISSDHMPDTGVEGCDTLEESFSFSSPRTPRMQPSHTMFSSSMSNLGYVSTFYDAADSRPKTAPIPPTLESPRANPRITSAKPPPLLRALGSTPNHLDEIINADVGFGRYQRRGPSSRLKVSRSPSPSFHLPSSRGATPDCSQVQRLASPDGKSEEWNRTTNVIEEEDEAALRSDKMGSGNNSRRPSSAGSLRSGREEKVEVQRRVSSAGTGNRRTRSSLHSSRSGSLSSVSHYNRGLSAMSRDHDFFARSLEFDEMEREESSPTWPGVRDELFMLHDEPADDGKQQARWEVSGDIAGSGTKSPSRDSTAKCPSPPPPPPRSPSVASRVATPSPPPRSPSVASRVATPSTRPPSVQSRHEKVARSRGSSVVSSAASEQWNEAVIAAADAEERKSSSSSRGRITTSPRNDGQDEEIQIEGDTRTSSAKSAQEGTETKATLGSEADLAQVSEAVVRSQSVVEGVYEEIFDDEETAATQEWPGVAEHVEDAEQDEMNKSDDEDSITQELVISTPEDLPEGSPEEDLVPIPSLNVQESSEQVSIQPVTPPNTAEYDEIRHEIKQETPTEEVHGNEVVTSSTPELHESETTVSVTGPREYEETVIVVPKLELVTAESAISDAVSTHVQDSEPTNAVPENLSINVQEPKADSTLITTEEAAEAPRASSPAPIKADQILHKELLGKTGLEIKGKVDDHRPASPYKEMIDIEKSRPSSPVNEEQRNIPVSIGEAVRNYIESGQEPQVRDRSARSRRGSGTGIQEKDTDKKADEKSSTSSMEGQPRIRPTTEAVKTTINKQPKPAPSSLSEKPKALSTAKSKVESKPDLPGLSLAKNNEKNKEVKEPTVEEREARRQMVSDLLSKRDAPKDGKLELEGIGKEGEEGESTSRGLVTRTSPTIAEKKNDLSDLAALVSKNRTPSKPKDKKTDLKKKPGKSSKSAKKKNEQESTIDPENIDFDAFNTPEMLDGMDDELRQFIQEQSKSDVTSAAVNQASDDTVVNEPVKRRESVQTMQMPQVAPEVSPDKKDAYAPSIPKKMSKKELAKLRADQRKEERKRKEEEKRLKEEEMRLLKEREEEAVRAKAEAEEKQKNIEEEKMKRMEEEEEAKRQEQEALEKLKEAKKKAREERESRRAAEAERRRLEVQKKRDEKKKREEELREREKELEQQRMNREKRMAEIDEARRRKEELERLEEEQRREEERLLALQMEEEERRLEEEKIREAEEELQRIQEERVYREQMRRIAEMQEAKLRQEEEERLRREEEERQRAEEERRKREEAEQERLREEQRRIEMARRLEALARMRSAQAAARRKALLLKRREDNMERMQSLKHTRCGQHITRAFVFTYYTHIPRKVWEVPIGFNKKKRGFGSPRRKPAPPKPP